MNNLELDIKAVLGKYNLLQYDRQRRVLSGEIELVSESNIYIDTFEVEIKLLNPFPKCFPKVTELGGKIPRTPARHVYPKTNYLCFSVPIEENLLCKNGITLMWFIDKVLVPRLCEEYRVNNGAKYQKEYSHDFGGTWEFLMTKLGIIDPEVILSIIKALATKNRPKGNEKCPCGSGQKV